MTTMKAMLIERYGKQQPLRLADVPVPAIGEHEILAEIHAASVNPVDFKIRDGKLKVLLHFDMPLILGNDFAGVVRAVGSKVQRFKVGDAVYGRPRKSNIGTFAQFIAAHEDDIAPKPANLSFEEAASVPLVGLTAYQALHDLMHLQAGQKILIQAGAGGVGTFAIQLAKSMGAYVATTAGEAGAPLVQSLGADRIINYHLENFAQVLHDYDAVLDTLGGEALLQSFQVLKPGGMVVSVSGIPDGRFARENGLGMFKTLLLSLASAKITRRARQSGAAYRFLFMHPSGEQLRRITALIEAGKIVPVIDRVFPFAQAQQALDYAQSGRAKGKIVVKIK